MLPRMISSPVRLVGILAALTAGLAVFLRAGESRGAAQPDPPTLHYVATARQNGPVGYRDPVGALSPEGTWLAFSEGRYLRLQRVEGGPVHTLGKIGSQIRHVAWHPDGQRVAVLDRAPREGEPRWMLFDITDGTVETLWPGITELSGEVLTGEAGETPEEKTREIAPGRLRQLTWSADGASVAGVVRSDTGWQLWILSAEGDAATVVESETRISDPVFQPDSNGVACVVTSGGRQTAHLSCENGISGPPAWSEESYGGMAFSPDGKTVYYGSPTSGGVLSLWQRSLESQTSRAIATFSRDAYAPSVTRDGRVLFRVQDYRAFLGAAPASGGPTAELTTFQSETPSWDWTGERIGFTYGSWRRFVDDFHYPDIAQHVGIVDVGGRPAEAPDAIVQRSTSEDQGMCWSPNGKWIAFHSHYGPSDDIWLIPADGSKPSRQITEGGHETGWPRWSPDGRWLVFPSHIDDPHRCELYMLGMDQEKGEVTTHQRKIALDGFDGSVSQAEWTPDSERLVFEAEESPSRRALYVVDRKGGPVEKIHEWSSEQAWSGLGLSSDGKWAAFVAPADDGHFQVFRIRTTGGAPEQVSFDPTDKTQPAYHPDGEQIAFTVFSYQSRFYWVRPTP